MQACPTESIRVTERDDGDAVAGALFRQRFHDDPPDMPHHVLTLLDGGTQPLPLCYIHFDVQGDFLLGGGACIDSRLLRRVHPDIRRSISAQGGLYHLSLAWAVRHFAGRYKAIFGYCGDTLAGRVDRAVGFADTGHKYLLVYWLADCDQATRTRLIAEAHAVGPF